MSRIDELIAEHCPDGVKYSPLGEVGEFIRGNGLSKSDLRDSGTPAIHYGQIHTFYGVWADKTKSFAEPALAAKLRRAKPGDLVIATTSEDDGAVAKATAWVGGEEVAVSGDAYIYRHSLDPLYVAYFFQSEQFQSQKTRHITGTKVRRLSGESLSKILIPVPPIQIQVEIAQILDRFTRLAAELAAELATRREQYEFYRDSLLSFNDAGTPPWRKATLAEILDMRAGTYVSRSMIAELQDQSHRVPCFGGNGVRGFVSEANRTGPNVLIGRQGALCGNTKLVDGDYYATEHAVVVSAKPGIDIGWAFHKLTHMNLNQYASKSAQPGLAVGSILKLEVDVPSEVEQVRIAEILNNFDALVNDISIGLPAEIKARRQQYEYYRDQLLSFKELAA